MVKKWKPPDTEVSPGRPYVAVTYDDLDIYYKIKKELISIFGNSDYETPTIDTEGLTSIYGQIVRTNFRLVSFRRLVGREELVDMRKKTINLEIRFQHEGRPLIELDPGYVGKFSVVRSTLEEKFHTIYLYHGVFAEILYYFEKMSYRPLPHTPEFYLKKEITTIFSDLRLIHTTES